MFEARDFGDFDAYVKEGVERANKLSAKGVVQVQLEVAQYAACVNSEEYEEMTVCDRWDALVAPIAQPLIDVKECLSDTIENIMEKKAWKAFPHRSIAEHTMNDRVREFGETADELTDSFAHDVDDHEGKDAVPLFKKSCDELIAAYIETAGAICNQPV